MSPFLQGMWLGGGLVLIGVFAGAWWQHRRHVREILSAGFWPLAKGYGDQRAEREVAAQRLAAGTTTASDPQARSRQSRAKFRRRRKM